MRKLPMEGVTHTVMVLRYLVMVMGHLMQMGKVVRS